MMRSIPLPQLIHPVINRAQAGVFKSMSGFIDNAAIAVLERLGIDVAHYPIKNKAIDTTLCRCKWIDKQVLHFVTTQPTAVCIEINGGLSTRFHRVSQQLEYPQFSFISINSQPTHRYIKAIFPKTENYHLSSKASPLTDWHHEVKPSFAQPYILIFGEDKSICDQKTIDNILLAAQRCLKEAATSIDILICHRMVNFPQVISEHYPNIQLVSSDSSSTHTFFNNISDNISNLLCHFSNHIKNKAGLSHKEIKSHIRII